MRELRYHPTWEQIARQAEEEFPHLLLKRKAALLTPGRFTYQAVCRHCETPLSKSYETPDVAACLAGLCDCDGAAKANRRTGRGPDALARLFPMGSGS